MLNSCTSVFIFFSLVIFNTLMCDGLMVIIFKNGRLFAVKDEIFCLFEGTLDNLGSLRQQYGLAKSANEVVLVIEAYKALRDRAPYPANHVVGHLEGNFAFIVFDKSTSTLFVATVSILHLHLHLHLPIAFTNCKLCSWSLQDKVARVVVTGSNWQGPSVLGNHC